MERLTYRGRLRLNIQKNTILEFTLAYFLYYEVFNTGLVWLFEGLHIPQVNLLPVLWGILAVLLLVSVISIGIHHVKADLYLIFALFVFLFLRPLANGAYWSAIMYRDVLRHVFIEGMISYFLARHIRDYRTLLDWMGKFAIIVFSLLVLDFFLVNVGSRANYKAYGRSHMLCFIVFAIYSLYFGKKKFILPLILSSVLAVTCGRRTVIIALAVVIIIILLLKHKYSYFILAALSAGVLFAFYDQILSMLIQIISAFGVHPRNLVRLNAGTLGEVSDRMIIWRYCLGVVSSSDSNALLGMGIGADRYYLLQGLWYGRTDGGFPYPHNIIVEMIFQFGYIFGIILSVLFVVLIPFYILRKSNIDGREFSTAFCMYIIACYSVLLFQDSYLINRSFYMLCALFASFIEMEKRKKKNRTYVR